MKEPDINKRVAQHWDREAKLWATVIRAKTDVFREGLALPAFLEVLGDVRGKNVLDLACGEGSVTRELARLGARMAAVDLSPAMIELAAEEEKREPLGISYHVGNSANLKALEDGAFDLVACFMAAMDIAAVENTFLEAARVMKKNGRLVFNVLHPCFQPPVAHWVYKEGGLREDADRLHFAVDRYFDRGSIEESLTISGLAPEPLYLTRIRFHRTLEDYVRALRTAGLYVYDLRESVASKEMIRKFPSLDRSRRIPYFLLIEARQTPK